ncbi:MAG: hypothetical protein Q7W56_10650 [Candidatus Latescibacteria bacterium]|nr:hypothetical protein [Candidatus Latescibacterota bacterium]
MKDRELFATKHLFLLAALVLSGCGHVSTYGPPPGAVNPVDNSRSLITADAKILSDQDIERILTARIEVPDKIRIAVLYLSHERDREWWWQPGFNEDASRSALVPVQRLVDNERVFDVSFLPSFLLPAQKSVPLIREAAARYQADWVLIVKTSTRDFWKDRVLGKDEARVLCDAECAVLDVRSGTIPYTSFATGEATVFKAKGEYSLSETSLRAEGQAVEQAMTTNIAGLLEFLGRLEGP